MLGVPKSSYYHQRKRQLRPPSGREKANATLLVQVQAVFAKHKERYGSPWVHAELKKQQVTCSLGRVKRLMRREGLYAVSTPKYCPKRERPEVAESTAGVSGAKEAVLGAALLGTGLLQRHERERH